MARSQPQWRKSSYSLSESQCVEVCDGSHRVGVRDSRHPHASWLACSRVEWRAFVTAVKSGEFDR
ncbi:DUF397 domain-containing protein [Allosalinactinospora lopnorensis]|uniref:DUF397 domain-containing protein n=1 Tax=Allosalinactinospora lopnorensis TaxID=1352348 RepID=UPI0009E65A9F|nr:DUF397 domain-containing protein [Allosalinactinospora lopnorensis]